MPRIEIELENEIRLSRVVCPQAARVVEIVKADGHITRLSAAHYGIANVTARLADLRNAGVKVRCISRRDAAGRRYGEWRMPPEYLAVAVQ